MNTKNTKKRFVLSLVVTIVSIAMLVGATFAWFTDSVTSGKNRIVAGNLDVDLLMDKGGEEGYVSIADGQGDIFKEADKAQNSNATLWEPGKTQFAKLAVENKGNLALKYVAYIDVTDNGLASALEYAIVSSKAPISTTGYTSWESVKTAIVDAGGATGSVAVGRTEINTGILDEIVNGTSGERDYVLLAVHMKEEAGNEYQEKDCLIDVNIVATQKDAEDDAFGPDYDKGAQFPVVASFPSIKKADVTDSSKTLTITQKGALESAEVKATGAKTVFESLENITEGYTNDMTLTLSVNETGSKEKEVVGGTEKTINLDINLSAVMNVTNSSGALVETKKNDNVEKLDEFTTIKLKIGKFSSVSVLHKNNVMQSLNSATEVPTDVINGGYFYDGEEFVYLVTKTFSPFTFNCLTEKTTLYYTISSVGGENIKIVSFAGKEWVVLNEDSITKTALVLMKDNLSAGTYGPKGTTNYAILYNNSDLDTTMNNYYMSLSEDDKNCIALSQFKESIVVNKRDESGTPSLYLEAGDPELDRLINELHLQGVAFNSITNNYTMERYVFAPSAKEMRDFGVSKLASVENGGVLNYSDVGGDYSYLIFITRTAESTRTGMVVTPDNTGKEDVSWGPMADAGIRPAMRLDLNKVQLILKAN